MKLMKGGTMYEQRDIILIPFPYSNLTGRKQRPALIISNKIVNKTKDKICCLITSNAPREGVLIKSGDFEKGRLPFKSWVKPQRLFTIDENIVRKRLCKMKVTFYEKILEEINRILGKD